LGAFRGFALPACNRVRACVCAHAHMRAQLSLSIPVACAVGCCMPSTCGHLCCSRH
jgi:hypothetical protein